jgi:hypothetical protein
MTLPPAASQISMSQVMVALNFSANPQTNISLLYSSSVITASTATTLNSLMYHNLFMGSGASQTAKQAIYDTFNSGNTFRFLNWGDYNSDPNIRLTWTITNNNIDNNINGAIYVSDGTNDYNVYNYNVNAAGGTDNQADYDTLLSVSTVNAKYFIKIDATAFYTGPPPPPGGGVTGNTTAASDTDGVGGGTARTPSNPTNFDTFSPLITTQIVAGHNLATGIALNKRTSFDIVFN